MSTRTGLGKPTLEYVKTIGLFQSTLGRCLYQPYDVAISADGRVFVANRCDIMAPVVRVSVCNLDDEEYLAEFGHEAGDGKLMLPTALAFDSRDRLHVTDEHLHRVLVFDSSGNHLGNWSRQGDGEGEVNGPSGIAFDSQDHAYVVDQHNHRVQKFTGDGEYVLQWGGHGTGAGQFNLPWGVGVDSGDYVYVADWRNDRVQKFTPEGAFVAAFGEPGDGDGQFHRPSGVEVDGSGFVYVADWGNHRVQVLGPDGAFHLKLRGEATLSRWAREYLDSNLEEKQKRAASNLMPDLPDYLRDPYHESTQIEPYFGAPVSVTIDKQGRLYVAESMRHRFQVYQISWQTAQ